MSAPGDLLNAVDIAAPGYYAPSQTALLLLDFHTMFVQNAGGEKAAAALEVAAKLRTWAKERGIHVIHALNDVNGTSFPTCKDADMFAGVFEAMRLSGTDVEPPELLEGGSDEVTFTRKAGYVSALKSPGLEDLLQNKGIKSLILAGLSTSGCVARTAFAASDSEYVVTVVSDGCADLDEEVHNFMVQKILNSRGYVATAAEIQQGLAKPAARNEV